VYLRNTSPPSTNNYAASINGIGTYEGKSYVVFGKNNTNAVELSSIAAGTGGFIIYGVYLRNTSPPSTNN
jgi:hypothetical protein